MSERWDNLLRLIRRQGAVCDAGADDAVLLDRFAADRDEVAFELLLQRYGPMVYAVCKRVVPTAADADDAFQATFLALINNASKVRRKGAVASWLHGAALRVSADLCRRQQRRHAREIKAARPEAAARLDPARDELLAALDQEVAGLPDRYRQPVVLCRVLDKSLAEAASTLGISVSAVWRRIQRGEELLRERLSRRGVAVPAGAIGGLFAVGTATAGPFPVARHMARAAIERETSHEVASLAARAVAPSIRSWATIAGVVTATALCGAGLWAAQSSQPRSVASPSEAVKPTVSTLAAETIVRQGVMTGRVFDHTGKPVPQADLLVIGRKSDQNPKPPEELLVRVTAGADGRFQLPIHQPEVGEGQGHKLIVMDLVGRGWVVTTVLEAGKASRGEVVIRLDEPGIRGWVVGPDSQPVAGVTVRAIRLDRDSPASTPQEYSGAITNPKGQFRLPDFDPTIPLRLIAEHQPTGMTATLDIDETRAGYGEVMLKLKPPSLPACPAK